MTLPLPLLQQAQIASPCPARWEDMTGDEVTRHCARCGLEVHNLSAMSAQAAEDFLRARAGRGRVCVRLFRRADGTVLTKDCPVGVALWRARAVRAAGRIAAAILFLACGGWIMSDERRAAATQRLRAVEPFRSVCEWFAPAAPPVTRVLTPVMGDICIPAPPPGPTGGPQ